MININAINQNNQYQQQSPQIERQYSNISAPYNTVGTGEAGLAIPIHWDFLLPSQYYQYQASIGIQFQPLISQLYHDFDCELHAYFVPNRIVDPDWEEFITGGKDGLTTKSQKIYSSAAIGALPDLFLHTLWDYFGLPIPEGGGPVSQDLEVLAYPWLSYNKIYNDILRFPDFEDERNELDNSLFRVHWQNDYFTRARAYQQRGVTPLVPVSDTILNHELVENFSGESLLKGLVYDNLDNISKSTLKKEGNELVFNNVDSNPTSPLGSTSRFSISPHDLNGLSFNLNDFWLSVSIQRYNINNARMQPRYVDQLYFRFGVDKEDVRLDLPEYVGSHSFRITQDGVVQTSADGETPLGTITGQAYGNNQTPTFSYDAKEHGTFIVLMSIRPKAVYFQGVNRKLLAKTRFDWPTPELANAPDVEIERQELYFNYYGSEQGNKHSIGWTDIYSEWRTNLNRVVGKVRPTAPQALASYTLARDISQDVELNATFLQCNPDVQRIKTYLNEPLFTFFVNHEVQYTIPLPLRSEPALLPSM